MARGTCHPVIVRHSLDTLTLVLLPIWDQRSIVRLPASTSRSNWPALISLAISSPMPVGRLPPILKRSSSRFTPFLFDAFHTEQQARYYRRGILFTVSCLLSPSVK